MGVSMGVVFTLRDAPLEAPQPDTITTPSLHRHRTVTAPSLHRHRTVTAPSLRHHCTTITAVKVNADADDPWAWLSRGLEEALLRFISRAAGPEWGLRVCVYEFTYAPVLQALAAARDRGPALYHHRPYI